ncbi:Secreted effector kinase SteC [Salmonella enterica subsp. houtenae serovar 44:z36,[z38]:-]|uniref:Secreted effector kinase SteC n=1 Tax=Salmonella enterica subsp. houtenae serovar 44:z36[z38]:- TaxID=1967609 RepID=A0A736I6T3_SALHO|nr:Secreted effector kinase SteC [Salmonella enterica]EHM8758228.1 Secreted effector kinase SteC [Salmonella enterica subsp. houtenae serovar 44:z36,[z38]:-]HAE7582094.1 Secreted effector kinase SteC [Salmonella enterica subsp. houtenae serovar 44:z36[z38]:-]HCM6269441.1 Secreted effector kinase SteC [Salmonella enterica subsp. houtenae serovar 44:z36,Z38:-]EGF3878689.1 Secreted effector kinase SteC [Salmonella enterica]
MPFTFYIGNHSCRISESHLKDIIENKREHIFSTCEKFIDFFRSVFTGRSLISDYKEIYTLLCQKKERPDIKGPFPLKKDESCTQWRPIIGYVKLIDASRPEAMGKYTVEVLAYRENTSLLKMYYESVLLAEAECSEHCLDFLKETMFNYNTGEITLTTLENENLPLDEANGNGRYAAFEQRLLEYLSPAPESAGDDGATAQTASQQEAVIDVFDSNATTQTASQQEAVIDVFDSNATTQTAPQQMAEIDIFINSPDFRKNICMADIEKNKIGSGSYGTVYLLNNEFAVKVPINNRGIKVNFTSQEHRNGHPDRVSNYLNMANDDNNFSRSAIMNINGENVTVLVSKYIKGEEFDISDDEKYRRAEELLESRGVYMHDMHILGNILVKEDVLFFVDGDQIVLSKDARQQRRVSLATMQLEEQIKARYLVNLKQAETKGDVEDIEYYQSLIKDFDALIGVEVQTPGPERRFNIAPPEEGALVAKVLKDELKK